MLVNNFSWKIGGPAGFGIKSSGYLFSKAMIRLGLHVFTYDEYPSLIRGGHNAFEAAVSSESIHAPLRPISILIALDQKTLDAHKQELASDGAVVFDPATVSIPQTLVPKTVRQCAVAIDEIIKRVEGQQIMRNTVALGASFALLGVSLDFMKQMIEQSFESKDPAVIVKNIKAASEGYEYVRKHYAAGFSYTVEKRANPGRLLMTGNEGLALGAIQAGCKVYSGYPMTPSTSVLHTIAAKADAYGIAFKQTEDEISAICTAIGAGYAGVRAMTATSGGGFALMAEALGMAGMVETPLVVVEAMRPGPSTGMPTWSGQGDLKFVLNASQDEFPRVVLAPGDLAQSFSLIQRAFNIAEKYQLPVVVITDKHLAECYHTMELTDIKPVAIDRGSILTEKKLSTMKEYKRYALTDTGISPRSLPGTPYGIHIANSDEHTEKGFSDESAEMRVQMMDKRFKKIETLEKELPAPIMEGDRHADITIISWGSTRGSILDAIALLKKQGKHVNFMQVVYLDPFPTKVVNDCMKRAKKVIVVENNKTGQLASLIKEKTGLDPHYKILKYDGRPFFVDELVETIKEIF